MLTASEASKFWARVRVGGPQECWSWTAGQTLGYGRFYLRGRLWSATHVALLLSGVSVPAGLFACHRCDTPSCVNPAHLFVGTQSENLRDCVTKGRHVPPVGGKNGQAKLSAAAVSEIRRLRLMGVRGRDVAMRFGVSQGAVSMIHRGHRWRGSL